MIVDLTHDNKGAYWEAGYADALGKPVIYICESDKFDKDGTHFDVDHCLTVMWDKEGDNSQFKTELTQALKGSLRRLD